MLSAAKARVARRVRIMPAPEMWLPSATGLAGGGGPPARMHEELDVEALVADALVEIEEAKRDGEDGADEQSAEKSAGELDHLEDVALRTLRTEGEEGERRKNDADDHAHGDNEQAT